MKHTSKKIPEYKKELVEVFAKLSGNKEFIDIFLKDILTPNEFETLALRWQIVKKLDKGEDHRSIVGDLGLGMSTVTRGSRMLRNKNGGLKVIFHIISHHHSYIYALVHGSIGKDIKQEFLDKGCG